MKRLLIALVAIGSVTAVAAPAAAADTPVSQSAVSANWSGYVVRSKSGSGFSSVSGSWTQQSVTCSAGQGSSSFWVGLGGFLIVAIVFEGGAGSVGGVRRGHVPNEVATAVVIHGLHDAATRCSAAGSEQKLGHVSKRLRETALRLNRGAVLSYKCSGKGEEKRFNAEVTELADDTE